jgi:hypothetical protein
MVKKFRDEFEAAIERGREAAPGPLDRPHADADGPVTTGVMA